MLPAYLLQDGSLVKDWQVINDDRPKYWMSYTCTCGSQTCYTTATYCIGYNPYIVCYKNNYKKGYVFSNGLIFCNTYVDQFGNVKDGESITACNVSCYNWTYCGKNIKYFHSCHMCICNQTNCIYGITTEGGCSWKFEPISCALNACTFVCEYASMIGLGDTYYCCWNCLTCVDVYCDLKLMKFTTSLTYSPLCVDMYTYPCNIVENIICNNSTQNVKQHRFNFYVCNCCCYGIQPAISIDKSSNKWAFLYPSVYCNRFMFDLFEMELPTKHECIYDNVTNTGIKKIWKIPKQIFWSCRNTISCCNYAILDCHAKYTSITKSCNFYILNASTCQPNLFCCGTINISDGYFRHSSVVLNTLNNTVYGITQCGGCDIYVYLNCNYMYRTPVFTAFTPRNTFLIVTSFCRCIRVYEYSCTLTPISGCCYAIETYVDSRNDYRFMYDCIEDSLILVNYDTFYQCSCIGCEATIHKFPANTNCVNNNINICYGTSCNMCSYYGVKYVLISKNITCGFTSAQPCILSYNIPDNEILCSSNVNSYITTTCLNTFACTFPCNFYLMCICTCCQKFPNFSITPITTDNSCSYTYLKISENRTDCGNNSNNPRHIRHVLYFPF